MDPKTISIDEYLGSGVEKRFEFLYFNYAIVKRLAKNYREDLIRDVEDMKAYNRRNANGDLGVRIQIGTGPARPTQTLAENKTLIAQAIDTRYLDDGFFKDTDDPQELIRRVELYHAVSKDYETFKMKLEAMDPDDLKILKPYLLRQKTINDLANEMEIEYRSAVMRIYRIKKKLSDNVIPRLRKGA